MDKKSKEPIQEKLRRQDSKIPQVILESPELQEEIRQCLKREVPKGDDEIDRVR